MTNLGIKLGAGVLIVGIPVLLFALRATPDEEITLAESTTNPPELTPDPNMLLPDLQIGSIEELYITRDPDNREREIRFDTTTMNIGRGPLELIGVYDESSNRTRVTQRLHTRDANAQERLAGHFIFHESHDHWHFEDFTLFELYTYRDDGSLDQLIASTDKMSFCLFDEARLSPSLPGAPESAVYPRCENDEIQGISPGWSDTYAATVEGQQLPIEPVPDGQYAVKTTIDPLNNIVEESKDNNSSVMYVEIQGMDITVIPEVLG